jgi:hypothetical protein
MSHIGNSWIDQLLLHKHDDLKIVKGGSDSGEAWIFLSDHRPIWAEIAIPGVIFDAGPTPAPFKTTQLKRPPSHNKTMLANYKAKVERKVLQLPSDLDPADMQSAIADISASCCPPDPSLRFTTAPATEAA